MFLTTPGCRVEELSDHHVEHTSFETDTKDSSYFVMPGLGTAVDGVDKNKSGLYQNTPIIPSELVVQQTKAGNDWKTAKAATSAQVHLFPYPSRQDGNGNEDEDMGQDDGDGIVNVTRSTGRKTG